jgi:hypothetical protein
VGTISGAQIIRAGAPLYLLWGTRPGLSLAEEIRWAAEAWRSKYGSAANTVYVHPSKMPEGAHVVIEGCVVLPREGVRPNTLWCGWEGGNK